MMGHSPKILVIGPSWVGDMVMAQVLFKSLKKRYPESMIDVLAPAWSAPLTARMPEITQSIDMPCKHGELGLKARYQLGVRLKDQYQEAYVLPNSFKSALVPFFAHIPKRIGFRGEFRHLLLTNTIKLNKQKWPLMIQRFAALLNPDETYDFNSLPKPALCVNELDVQKALSKHHLEMNQPVLALCPGAEFGPSKRWPEEKFAQIANHCLKAGWQVWIFGSAKDTRVAFNIEKKCVRSVKNLTGQTSLAEAIDLLSLATAVVTNDSGLMHIASALNRFVIALYGSTDPGFTPPLGKDVLIHKTSLSCSPCFKRVCPLKHHDCMNKLDAKPVIDAIDRLKV